VIGKQLESVKIVGKKPNI